MLLVGAGEAEEKLKREFPSISLITYEGEGDLIGGRS